MTQLVSDVMTPDPVCVAPDTSLLDTARQMRDQGIGAVLVVDDGQLLGIITDRDLVVRAMAEGLDGGSTDIGDVTTPSVAVVTAGSLLSQAELLMRRQRIRRLPVCDETGHPVGIVSLGDPAGGVQLGRAADLTGSDAPR